MKRKQFTEEQISYSLRQAESGVPVAEVCRKLGVCTSSDKVDILGSGVKIRFSV